MSLETMIPFTQKVEVHGQEIEVRPVKVKQLAAVTRAMAPLKELFDLKTFDKNKVLAGAFEHAEAVARLTEVCTGLERNAMDEWEIDEMIDLFVAVLEVNLDFFTRRVFPSVSRGMGAISVGSKRAGAKPSTGPTPSNSSSETVTE
jgi:hypothetical protein